jgi:hypothetical protein
MPIRREYRKFYTKDWKLYRVVLIERARNRCQHCGAVLPAHELAGAHLTHDPKSSEIAVLCFPCHGRHDWRHSRAMARRTLAKRFGQGWLTPELEWAPFPLWMAPRRLVVVPGPVQGELWAA